MTNEEAFEKFWEDRQAKGLDAANRCEYEETWQAAITYMQEQSEPIGVVKYLYEDNDDCLNKAELPAIMLNPIVTEKLGNLINAIMDEMERIDK